jgi:hypothetical protein
VGQLGQDEPVAEGGQHHHHEDKYGLLLGRAEIHRGRRYLSRRIGRSQNGLEGWSSWPRPRAGWPPRSAGSADAGLGFGPAADRCLALTAGHPLDGQAGAEPPLLLPLPRPPLLPPLPLLPPVPLLPLLAPVLRLMGGAEAERAETREGLEEPEDAARVRGPTGPTPAELPAPRDQAAAAPDAADDPDAPDDPDDPDAPDDPLLPDLGGRSSGGATRPPPLAASGMFGLRVVPAAPTPLTTRREPVLVSPSPSAGGGASGRSREAYASLEALATLPARAAVSAEAAVPAATPAPAPTAAPAATAATAPGLRRAHRAAR